MFPKKSFNKLSSAQIRSILKHVALTDRMTGVVELWGRLKEGYGWRWFCKRHNGANSTGEIA